MSYYELEQLLEQLIDNLCDEFERKHQSTVLWQALLLDGQFDLISRLHQAESGNSCFQTLAVPKEGFSFNPRIHQLVIKWCHKHKIRLFNSELLIHQMEETFA